MFTPLLPPGFRFGRQRTRGLAEQALHVHGQHGVWLTSGLDMGVEAHVVSPIGRGAGRSGVDSDTFGASRSTGQSRD